MATFKPLERERRYEGRGGEKKWRGEVERRRYAITSW
jgi:hypothetical protein